MTYVESLVATNSDELIPDCLESLIDNGYGSAGLELELWSVLRQLLNRMIPDRWFFASLMSLVRRLADPPAEPDSTLGRAFIFADPAPQRVAGDPLSLIEQCSPEGCPLHFAGTNAREMRI
jgi:hypothetical protein